MSTFKSTKTYKSSKGLSCCFRQYKANSHCQYLHGYSLEISLEFAAKNLDEKNCELLMELIVKLNSDLNGTFIIATHDKRFKDISNNVYSLFNGELISNE